ncbi:hypothetical protein DM01DRAFT_1028852 [Hesseltinella vesiculosa]|uniref:Uncharacterized protein n=1 Tax=Hesseltinella vesiculosa TaxID=101127 RepID=A0A1X2GJ21_9FUNG|nr:hypothetical protein DM01DRAFT_1028852 [Hesseltinella vesiculosa]
MLLSCHKRELKIKPQRIMKNFLWRCYKKTVELIFQLLLLPFCFILFWPFGPEG